MLACIIILTLYLAVPITLATAALFRPEIGAKTVPAPVKFWRGQTHSAKIESIPSPLSSAAKSARSLD